MLDVQNIMYVNIVHSCVNNLLQRKINNIWYEIHSSRNHLKHGLSATY